MMPLAVKGRAIELTRRIVSISDQCDTNRDYRSQKTLKKERDQLAHQYSTKKIEPCLSCRFYLDIQSQNIEQNKLAIESESTQRKNQLSIDESKEYDENSILQMLQEYSDSGSSFYQCSEAKDVDQVFQSVTLGRKVKIKDFLEQLKKQINNQQHLLV